MDRRTFLRLSTAFGGYALVGAPGFAAPNALDLDFDAEFAEIQQDPAAAQETVAFRDFAMADDGAACIPITLNGKTTCVVSAARQPPRIPPSQLQISDASRQFILFYEVTSETNYNAKLKAPIWPGGDSGVTIGIGYDLGYASADDMITEWSKYVHPFILNQLKPLCGKKGAAAQSAISSVGHVRIEWDGAYRQFTESLLPIFVALTETFCQNVEDLPPDCRGALTSLVFNRGTALKLKNDPIDSRREMREIRDLMASKQYDAIPQKFLDMQRLWIDKPNARGVVKRRAGEAALFAKGLKS